MESAPRLSSPHDVPVDDLQSSQTSPTESTTSVEELVGVFMVQHQQEMKDILYESCKQAVQTIAQRALISYVKSGASINATADNCKDATLLGSGQKLQAAVYPQVLGVVSKKEDKLPARTFGSYLSSVPESTPDENTQPLCLGPKTRMHLSPVPESAPDEITQPLCVSRVSRPSNAGYGGSAGTASTASNLNLKGIRAGLPHKLQELNIPNIGGSWAPSWVLNAKKGAARQSVASSKSRYSTASGRKSTRSVGRREKKPGGPGKMKGVFVDGEAMKEKLRAAMTEKPYDVTEYYKTTGFCQAVARSHFMENVTLSVIGLNALWIAIDVDLNKASIVSDSDAIFQIADNLFCLFFTFETSIRFGAFEDKKNCLKDAWFVFDSAMCIMMVFETWLLPLLLLMFAHKAGGQAIGDASVLKGLRLARMMRMARMLRLLRALPELMVVIKGLFAAARAVSCTILLILILIYVFAIMFRALTDGTECGRTLFPDVPSTMRFLLVQGTMPDLYDPIYDIWDSGVIYALFFLFFILITSITVMNMLVGVLVGVVDTVSSVEKEQLMVNFVKEHLLHLLKAMQTEDNDSDGLISKREFCQLIENPEAIRSFSAMGVDVFGLVDLADFIWRDESTGVPFAHFMEMIMNLRGSNAATVKDIVDLRMFMTMEIRMFQRMMERMNPDLNLSTASAFLAEENNLMFPNLHAQKKKESQHPTAVDDNMLPSISERECFEGEDELQLVRPERSVEKKKKVHSQTVPVMSERECLEGQDELPLVRPEGSVEKKKRVKRNKSMKNSNGSSDSLAETGNVFGNEEGDKE